MIFYLTDREIVIYKSRRNDMIDLSFFSTFIAAIFINVLCILGVVDARYTFLACLIISVDSIFTYFVKGTRRKKNDTKQLVLDIAKLIVVIICIITFFMVVGTTNLFWPAK